MKGRFMGKLTLGLIGIAGFTMLFVIVGAMDPQGALAGLLFGGSGFLAFITGPIWLYQHMSRQAVAQISTVAPKDIKLMTDAEIADFVDEAINKHISVAAHPWLAAHWHQMSAVEKVKWVGQRRLQLNVVLKSATHPMEFVNALQAADKSFAMAAA
jgi:hypothetical protein